MRLQEALFLSSQRKSIYERGLLPDNTAHAFRCYRVQVERKEETYHIIERDPEKTRTVYEISVSRREGKTIYPPHIIEKTFSLDDCLGELSIWTIGEEFEHAWQPIEEWEPKPIIKQTELAEKILGWVKRNQEEIQDMAVYNQAVKFSIFLTDVEKLCHAYLEDGLDTKEVQP